MSVRSCTSGAKPFSCRCVTHLAQHPHDGSLYTVIDVGFGAAIARPGSSSASTAPLHSMPAARVTQARRFITVASVIGLLLIHAEVRAATHEARSRTLATYSCSV